MITGKYFSSLLASFIYSIIGIVFLTLTYFVFIKRFFPKISNGIATAGLVIVQASSFIWYLMIRGDIYELAQTSGFAFLMSGAFFLLSSGVIGKGKVSRVKICISTVLLSIAVLCRAVLALYCVVAYLAKKALCRDTAIRNPKKLYKDLEDKMLEQINKLGIGPQGFGGKITAQCVNIEQAPTHIAGLPVAVNIGCHVTRHASALI